MKSSFKDFARHTIKELQGDQDDFGKFSMKDKCRKLLRQEARDRKAKRKAVKASKKRSR